MMHVLWREHLEDEDFLRNQADGYEQFLPEIRKATPEWAQGITGIPAEVIEELAHVYGKAKAPAIVLGSGLSRYGNGGMTVRLITILSALQEPGSGQAVASADATTIWVILLIQSGSQDRISEKNRHGS